jgi:hypothetical protein
MGGDRTVANDTHRAIINAMAEGIKAGDGGQHLMTFHPQGGETSSQYFHDAPWLDFNMYQTGHARDRDNYNSIASDYNKTPIKPCLDAEPGYEDHPSAFDPKNGFLADYDVRKSAYWALFAGACGHTYGCHDIWQFYNPDRFKQISWARTPWQKAMDLPGAGQMQYARALIESRPFLSRIPDQSVVVSDAGGGTDRVQATRDANGSYALVYSASGKPFTVDMTKLSGAKVKASWFDPRNGSTKVADEYSNAGRQEFVPPSSGPGNDWVLVLDDTLKNYAAPDVARLKNAL